MTDVEKRNVVKGIVTNSGILYDIDMYKKDNIEKHYENLMGSDSFFVLSSKVTMDSFDCSRKELYVIVDEKYAFLQLTTYYEENGLLVKRMDEIVRYKKFNNEVFVEKAKLVQDKAIVELHSIEEMKKVDKDFVDSMVDHEIIEVVPEFKFTMGFDGFNATNNKTNYLEKNIIEKYIEFSLESRSAA